MPTFDLQRFVDAQDPLYGDVVRELRAGEKTSHWMWFIFPQIAGLGSSYMARSFAIESREEATAYLEHSILGPRLIECTSLVNSVTGRSSIQIFGSIDALKFRSSMTLFSVVSTEPSPFSAALRKYCDGKPDQRTLELLDSLGSDPSREAH
jgi:uncharacterized protein (DUF1810 family)